MTVCPFLTKIAVAALCPDLDEVPGLRHVGGPMTEPEQPDTDATETEAVADAAAEDVAPEPAPEG